MALYVNNWKDFQDRISKIHDAVVGYFGESDPVKRRRMTVSILGYLLYYTAGVGFTREAKTLQKKYRAELAYVGVCSKRDGKAFMREFFEEANNVASPLIKNGSNTREIATEHAKKFLASNNIEAEDKYVNMLVGHFMKYYNYIVKVWNKEIEDWKKKNKH